MCTHDSQAIRWQCQLIVRDMPGVMFELLPRVLHYITLLNMVGCIVGHKMFVHLVLIYLKVDKIPALLLRLLILTLMVR